MSKILLINGPNLNLLGTREPEKYGTTTLREIETKCYDIAKSFNGQLETYQSNTEGLIVDRIQLARSQNVDFILINAGAYTHTSVAIRDALLAVNIPYIEIHISNVHSREPFRHHSYLADKAVAVVAGLSNYGYEAALTYALSIHK